HWVRLPDSNWNNAECTGVDLREAELSRATCFRAVFARCDLREANLSGVDATNAQFPGCRFSGAKLRGCNFIGANLLNARELTSDQLLTAQTSDRTILPDGSRGPYRRYSGAERPRSAV